MVAATSTLRAVLLVAVAAAAPSHGCRTPRARLESELLQATHPELVLLRCRISGFRGRPRFSWKLPSGVRLYASNEPVDEGALLVQVNDTPHPELVQCDAIHEPDSATALLALGPSQVTAAHAAAATATAVALLTVDGSGFTVERGEDDAVWLVPARGVAVRADHACKLASWSESHIVACLPKLASGSYQVRVQSGGRLAAGPSLTLGAL